MRLHRTFLLFTATLLASFCPASEPHLRVVWCQDHSPTGNDVFAKRAELNLLGFDNRDGRGERVLIPELGNVAKPLFTADGQTVVFSDRLTDSIWTIGFDGKNLTRLTTGFAGEVWRHPTTGVDYVMAMREPYAVKSLPGYARVQMVPLNDPTAEIRLWHGPLIAADNFQISADGFRAGALFPWPNGGIADLRNGKITPMGRGCWPSFAPDNSGALWIFDGPHRTMTVYHEGREWLLPVNTAPSIKGAEVYHPRWSNHPQYLTLSGPYPKSSIRDGDHQVEIFVGRMNPGLTNVDAWTQISRNQRADFFPDLWVEGGENVSLDLASAPAAGVEPVAVVARTVTATLVEASVVPSPKDILPYKRCLVANHYRTTDGEEFAALHWCIQNMKPLPGAIREVGKSYTLRLVPYAAQKELRGDRVANQLADFELEMYVDLGK